MNESPLPQENESLPPADGQPDALGRSRPAHRGVAVGFSLMAIAIVGFSAWWARLLGENHIRAFHGCACGRISRENLAMFGFLPGVSGLVVYGAKQTAVREALAVAAIGLGGTCIAYGILGALYFGLLYARPS